MVSERKKGKVDINSWADSAVDTAETENDGKTKEVNQVSKQAEKTKASELLKSEKEERELKGLRLKKETIKMIEELAYKTDNTQSATVDAAVRFFYETVQEELKK